MNAEGEIRRAQASYVHGHISVDELESRVWDALTGKWGPTSGLATVLKERWAADTLAATDAPGQVLTTVPTWYGNYLTSVERAKRDWATMTHAEINAYMAEHVRAARP